MTRKNNQSNEKNNHQDNLVDCKEIKIDEELYDENINIKLEDTSDLISHTNQDEDKEDHIKNTSSALILHPKQTTLQKYLAKIAKIPSLSQEEEFKLAIAYTQNNDVEAAHRLVRSHLKLVAKIALSYKNYNIPTIDMISEGNIGLLRAVDKYNPNLGYRLSTYAMWWIRASIQNYILYSWSMVRSITTSAKKKLFLSLRKLKKHIINSHDVDNTQEYAKIAKELNFSIKEVIAMEDRINSPDVSLYQEINQDSSSPKQLIDTIETNQQTQESKIIALQEKSIQKKMLNDALSILNERELKVLKSRNLVEKPITLEVLSKELNISKERVRQIEESAIKKIKKYILQIKQDNIKYTKQI